MSEVLLQQLKKHAENANGKFTILRKGEVAVEVDQGKIKGFISNLVNDLRVSHLSTMTGLDLGPNIGIIYHFSRDKDMINVKTFVPKTQPTARLNSGHHPRRNPLRDGNSRYVRSQLRRQSMDGQETASPRHLASGPATAASEKLETC